MLREQLRRRRKGDLPFATGRKLDQGGVTELAQNQKLILVCGRYEGIDERLIQTEIDEEWSIGDYVLTGGELPAMTLIDAVAFYSRCIRQASLRRKKILSQMVY